MLFMTPWVWSWAVFTTGCFFHSIWHWLGSLTHLHSEGGWAGREGPRRLHSHPGLSLPMRPLISQQCSPSHLRHSTASQGHSNTSSIFCWPEQVTGQPRITWKGKQITALDGKSWQTEWKELVVTVFEGYLPQSMDEKMNRQMSHKLPSSSHSG